MAKTTLTFELGGRVEISDLEKGIITFRRLIVALTPKKMGVAWVVEDMQPGSATATLRGEADNISNVEKVVKDYENIGAALARHEDLLQYNKKVANVANAIRALARSLEYVRFETPDADYTIYSNGSMQSQPSTTTAIGAVTGRVQTLSNRTGLRFNLYDTIHNKAVACYLSPGQEELMREAWDRRARVSGRVSREGATGRPVAIRQILGVEILEDPAPGSYRLARGAVPWQEGDILPEDAVRLLRDA
jgi:hypothetical protein